MCSVCNLTSDFYITNQLFTVFYFTDYCKLFCVVNRKLVFVAYCKDLESAKERAKLYMGEES